MPEEFAEAYGCGKDGGFATLENAARFPLSHSHSGDGAFFVSEVKSKTPEANL